MQKQQQQQQSHIRNATLIIISHTWIVESIFHWICLVGFAWNLVNSRFVVVVGRSSERTSAQLNSVNRLHANMRHWCKLQNIRNEYERTKENLNSSYSNDEENSFLISWNKEKKRNKWHSLDFIKRVCHSRVNLARNWKRRVIM